MAPTIVVDVSTTFLRHAHRGMVGTQAEAISSSPEPRTLAWVLADYTTPKPLVRTSLMVRAARGTCHLLQTPLGRMGPRGKQLSLACPLDLGHGVCEGGMAFTPFVRIWTPIKNRQGINT